MASSALHRNLLEVKDGKKPPGMRKLSRDEAEFAERWCGHGAIVTSVDEAPREVLGREFLRTAAAGKGKEG